MNRCEGCDLVACGKASPNSARFRRQYPQCPGRPSVSCHGYLAGCNCADCRERDRDDRALYEQARGGAGSWKR